MLRALVGVYNVGATPSPRRQEACSYRLAGAW